VVVDRLWKMWHFIPCHTMIHAFGLAKLFFKEPVYLHGLPATIVSDRGPQFASTLWCQICNCLGIEPTMSTAFYTQMNGLTDRINVSMKQYRRVFDNHQQGDSVNWLPMDEFAAKDMTSDTKKCSRFFAFQGTDPWMTFWK